MVLLYTEFALSIIAIVFSFIAPRFGDRWFSAIERQVSRLAERRRFSVVAVLFLALGARLAVLPIEPIPHPGIHDEFSHLLIADTLLHGRLANPTPAMWVHFETFHENFVPAYASMYYPGQGIILAIGKLLFGHPFWGVWLSTGLMCAAICWALQGWLPPNWALLGGILAIVRLGTFSQWANSYWGGSVAALGGALVLGALPRIADRLNARDAILIAVGFALLANSRPYEGLYLSIPVVVAVCVLAARKSSPPMSAWATKIFLPIGVVLAVTFSMMTFYFYRTTGSPFTIPYQINMRTYGYVYFPWQHFNTAIDFHHQAMRSFYEENLFESAVFYRLHFLTVVALRCLWLWSFFLGFALTMPLFFVLPATRVGLKVSDLNWRTLLCSAVLACSLIGILLPLYFSAHYAASATAALYVIYLGALKTVSSWSPWRRPVGRMLVRLVPTLCIVLAGVYTAVPSSRPAKFFSIPSWCTRWQPLDRADVEQSLSSQDGGQLVIVSYSARHDPVEEWVFNSADIDKSKVVWARDMGPEKNQELLNYYHYRKVWRLNPDFNPPRLVLYSGSRGTN